MNRLCKAGRLEEAKARYEKAPNAFDAAVLIGAWTKQTHSLQEPLDIYNKLKQSKSKLNPYVFSAMFNAFKKAGQHKQAVSFFREMLQERIQPNHVHSALLNNLQ